ncbi:MAG: protein kinase, partial [Verrucomicrobiales bacterium]
FVLKENFPVFFTSRHPESLKAGPLDIDGGDAESFVWSVENFEHEARQLAAIFHPGVVRVLKTFRAFGTVFYVMPLVEGSSLEKEIEHRGACGLDFSEDEITGLLWRMLNALECLHDQGIYHLDIHPENILITEQGIPCLKNFGAARQHLCERFLTVVESSTYTPPEQLMPGGKVGPWSDLFALAACLRTAITGEDPSTGSGASGNHSLSPLSDRDEFRGRYSSELLASIDRALDPSVGARFRSVADWRAALWDGSTAAPVPNEERVVAIPETERGRIPFASSEETDLPGQSFEKEDSIVAALPDIDFLELIPAEAKPRPAISFGGLVCAMLVIGALVVLLVWRFPPSQESGKVKLPNTTELAGQNVSAVIISEPDQPPLTPSVATPAPDPVVEIAPEPVPVAPVVVPVPVLEGSKAGEERVFEGIAMCWCPPGQFQMGSPLNENGRFQDESPYQVHLTRGFWIAKTELTQGQWT